MDVLTSIGVIIVFALLIGGILKKINVPNLVGMLIVGIVLGPYVLNLISPSIISISPDIRKMALIVILTRAGLSLKRSDLKKVGRVALKMSFLPALFEMVAVMVFAVLILQTSFLDGAIMGSVLAAVSPAVVVPRMLKIKKEGYGQKNAVPQMIMGGASVDDVFVIVVFSSLTAMAVAGKLDLNFLWQIPVSIVLGIGLGSLFGKIFAKFFKTIHCRDTIKVLLILSFAFLFVAFETYLGNIIPFSSLLAIIGLAFSFNQNHEVCANRLSSKFSKVWVFAEILLFVLVGCEVDLNFAFQSGGLIVAVILLALIFRMLGVYVCTIGSKLSKKEKLFSMFAYVPKATVQAGIGSVPLAMGLSCGKLVLTAAVWSIVLTAPIGALLIDLTYKKLLKKDEKEPTKYYELFKNAEIVRILK